MEKPKYLINNICTPNIKFEEIKKTLLTNGIISKIYEEDNLILIYNNYNISVKSDLQKECRSLVLDKTSYNIIAYSCETPMLNNDGLDYIKKYDKTLEYVTTCYEGSCLSLFYYNNKWYLSSRKHLNSINNNLSPKYESLYNLFEQVLIDSGYESFDNFTKNLDTNYSYYFVLVHYNNKHMIDYTTVFENENYKKLVLISVKDKDMQENINLENIKFLCNNIFLPPSDSINNYLLTNLNQLKFNINSYCEGIIIHKWDNKNNKFKLIKLQYSNYIYQSLIKINEIYGLIYLYQIDMFEKQSSNKLFEIDIIFKICSSELYELFKSIYDIYTANILINNIEYNKLPKEYKYILYKLRGIIYKNKTSLKINDIYKLLKRIPVTYFISLLKVRNNLKDYFDSNENIKIYCNKYHIKIFNDFIIKL